MFHNVGNHYNWRCNLSWPWKLSTKSKGASQTFLKLQFNINHMQALNVMLHDSRPKSVNQIQIQRVQILHPGSVECELSNREEEGVPLLGCLNADCRKQSRLLIIKLGSRARRLCEYTELSCVGGWSICRGGLLQTSYFILQLFSTLMQMLCFV